MNDYQTEQMETLTMIRSHFSEMGEAERKKLRASLKDYLAFRADTAAFLAGHFGHLCTRNCYENRMSACCSKDGIITFFADAAVNVLLSSDAQLDALADVLVKTHTGFKCVYLSEKGCLWRIKPIVCEMFLCDSAKAEIFGNNPALKEEWETLEKRRKGFTWPDRPVLFDELEQIFLDAGYRSPLMYLHISPGLLRIRRNSARHPD
ncbi:MAG: hypothetical protein AB7S75_06850 [Desulfococcaceae bacterium]